MNEIISFEIQKFSLKKNVVHKMAAILCQVNQAAPSQ